MFARHVSGLLAPYCRGEATPAQRRRVEAHLARCERCRGELEGFRLAEACLSRLPLVQAPEQLWGRIEAGLAALPARPSSARPRLLARPGLHIALPALAAAVAVAVIVVARQGRSKPPVPSWSVVGVEGAPRVGSRTLTGTGRIRLGEWLETDSASRARIQVADIGQVEVRPSTRVRMTASGRSQHRLSLARGEMAARVTAPPRLFLVDTPAALAADLGCAYTLKVDDGGAGLLRVTSGRVSLERGSRQSVVPAGAECRTLPGQGPGTPCFSDALPGLKAAVDRFDSGDPASLTAVLATARPRDALTLWHLLARTEGADRAAVYDRMAALVAAPAGTKRSQALALHTPTLDRWWAQIQTLWTFDPFGNWQQQVLTYAKSRQEPERKATTEQGSKSARE